jgi:hypothetical protein
LFATGVIYTGGNFVAGIVDTGGKFATSINNASENGGKIDRSENFLKNLKQS